MEYRKEGWYWVRLPYYSGHNNRCIPGPWICMEFDHKGGWWFDEQSRYIDEEEDLKMIGPYIRAPDEEDEEEEDKRIELEVRQQAEALLSTIIT